MWSGLDTILIFLAQHGYVDQVDQLIDRSRPIALAEIAALGGHWSVIDLVLSLSPHLSTHDLNWIAYNAARGGHIDLVQRLIGLGASDYESMACMAASSGYTATVNWFLDRYPNLPLDYIAYHAVAGGYYDLVDQLLSRGVTNHRSLIECAVKYNQPLLVELIQSYQ